ncbi:MAG: carboxypeptidase-like regulatory domain-containing protein [Actinomycetota bacterium]
MRRRLLLVALFTGLAALVAWGQVAGAQSVERVRIADAARQQHGLPAGLVIELTSPAEYNRLSVSGDSGRWTGPRYEEPGNPANGANSLLDWTVTFDERQGDTEAVALANVVHTNWVRDQRGGLSVPHVVGQISVGTILGYFVLLTPGGNDARFEGVIAFPLDVNLHAVVHFEAPEPASDAFVVKGSIVPSTWNRGQVLLALTGARLQGNLPPKIVEARPYERGRLVKGKVVDRFLDSVLGAQVSLERRSGGRWAKVAGTRTNQRGRYSVRAKGRGTYRVTVRMAGFTAMSREIRAGR